VALSFLRTDVAFLKGIGPSRAELLQAELGIFTFGDLLEHYPFRYVDKSTYSLIKDVGEGSGYIQMRGVIHSVKESGFGKKGKRLTAKFQDESGTIDLQWFQGAAFIINILRPGSTYTVFGKPSKYKGRLAMAHPELVLWEEGKPPVKGFEAVYSTTEKLRKRNLDSRGIAKAIKLLLNQMKSQHIVDFIPKHILDKHNLISRSEALRCIHSPRNLNESAEAAKRIKFEEFFLPQLSMLKAKWRRQAQSKGYVLARIDNHFDRFFHEQMPFELTDAQKNVVREIRADVKSGRQMNRLLQGDVGSGKTIVAVLSMLMAIDNGYQAAFMAPTEILAQQHYQSISKLIEPIGLTIALLTSSVKGEAREKALTDLSSGKLNIIVGTHALIQQNVVFNQLGMAVIDEQHRFGVAQRASLWQKTSSNIPPHILVMTATPIPRTLAMTAYGDLDVSVIDQLPPGRKPIKTMARTESNRLRLFGFLKEQVEEGRQVYIVYPLIQESEKLDLKNLFDGFNDVQHYFPYPNYKTSVVHGKLKPDEKEIEMQRFVTGFTNVMVATTVIEVGVDVPNATVMVIENAERFGLAQLHQLRGRVGRSGHQSYCVLMTKDDLSANAKTRIDTMVRTNNGFEIAEVDLQLRGPGDIEGTRQSGDLQFKLASLSFDRDILSAARVAARELIESDPELDNGEHRALRQFMSQHSRYGIDWSRIS